MKLGVTLILCLDVIVRVLHYLKLEVVTFGRGLTPISSK